jgi:hypothetical protein
MNWDDWDDIWQGLGFAFVIIAIVTLGTLIFSTKNIDYYYLTTAQTGGVVCAEQHWTWHPDQHAFCTDDVNKAVDVVTKLNATIKK